MAVQINSATGPRNNRTTLEGRTAYTLLVLNMDTGGMTWTVLHVISILVKKITMIVLILRVKMVEHALMVRETFAVSVLAITGEAGARILTHVPVVPV